MIPNTDSPRRPYLFSEIRSLADYPGLDQLESLINSVDSTSEKNHPIFDCLELQYTKMVQTLFLSKGCEIGDLELVELLLKDGRVNPTFENNAAINIVCKNGHYNLFKFLLSFKSEKGDRIQPSKDCLINACTGGHRKIIKLLLKDKRIDPSVNDNLAIRAVCQSGYVEIVKKLCKDPRVDKRIGLKIALICNERSNRKLIIGLLIEEIVGKTSRLSEMMGETMDIPKDVIRVIQKLSILIEL